MIRTAKVGHRLSENKARERQRCNRIKTTKQNILENIGREHHAAEVAPSTLSATLKVLGVTSAAARSRVGFSNIWGFAFFIVLKLWRSRALFSDSLWPTLAVLIIS